LLLLVEAALPAMDRPVDAMKEITESTLKGEIMKERVRSRMLLVRSMLVAVVVFSIFYHFGLCEGRSQINLSLNEYLEQTNESWFLTGKKEYTIQAMMVSKALSFHNELENVDYVAIDDGETVVLRGTRGEMWTSLLSQVITRYVKPDGSELREEDFAEKDAFIDIVAIPTRDSYYAMHVPVDISVTVETAWGDVLHTNLPNARHGEGDYLVCTVQEGGKPNLSDIWVLNGLIFPDCYDTSGMKPQ